MTWNPKQCWRKSNRSTKDPCLLKSWAGGKPRTLRITAMAALICINFVSIKLSPSYCNWVFCCLDTRHQWNEKMWIIQEVSDLRLLHNCMLNASLLKWKNVKFSFSMDCISLNKCLCWKRWETLRKRNA